MNPPPPNDGLPPPSPREELEARIAAFILGEAGEFDAETLRARIAADPEMAALHRRLSDAAQAYKNTFEDERVAAALPPTPAAPEHLSPERRAALERLFTASASPAPDNAAATEKADKTTRSPLLRFPGARILAAAACLLFVGFFVLRVARFSTSATLSASSSDVSAAKNALAHNAKVDVAWDKKELPQVVAEAVPAEPANEPTPALPKLLSAQEVASSVASSTPPENYALSLNQEPVLKQSQELVASSPASGTTTTAKGESQLITNLGTLTRTAGEALISDLGGLSGSHDLALSNVTTGGADSLATSTPVPAQTLADNYAAYGISSDALAAAPPPPPPPPPPPMPAPGARAPGLAQGGAGGRGFGAGGPGGGGGFGGGPGGAGLRGGRRAGGRPAVATTTPSAPGATPLLSGSFGGIAAITPPAPAEQLAELPTLSNSATPMARGLAALGRQAEGTEPSQRQDGDVAAATPSFNYNWAYSGTNSISPNGETDARDARSRNVALIVGSNEQNTTYSGVISGGGSLTKNGTAALVAGTNNDSDSSKSAAEANGNMNLYFLSDANLGGVEGGKNQVQTFTGSTVVSGGNVQLDFEAPGAQSAAAKSTKFGNRSIVSTGIIGGNSDLVKTGAGTVTLTGNQTYTGNISIAGGTVQLGDGSVAQAVTGNGTLVKAGNGVLTLTGINTYTGSTVVSGGTLQMGTAGSIAADNNALRNEAKKDDVAAADAVASNGNNVVFRGAVSGSGNLTRFNTVSNFGSGSPSSANLAGGGLQWSDGASTGLGGASGDARLAPAQVMTQNQSNQSAPAYHASTTESLAPSARNSTDPALAFGDAPAASLAKAPTSEVAANARTYNRQLQPLPPVQLQLREKEIADTMADTPVERPASNVQFPAPVSTEANPFSTFSLNVSDVAYRLALAALQNRRWPEPANVRTEEFLNAFQYHDPAPRPDEPCALNYELARNPFEAAGDLLRVSFQTSAVGRDRSTPLRATILLDASGSMTRADRVATLQAAIRALGAQLRPGDSVSLVTFARTAQARAVGLTTENFGEISRIVGTLVPEGGTNMEDALQTAYQIARQTFQPGAQNRVILLTDGAANLGQLDPKLLADVVEQNRRAGIALDAYGVGWEGYDDAVLEALTRHSDGRYGFLKGPEDVDAAFAEKLAGALAPAALDVKLQIEFNPRRVNSYRLMGYNNQRLTREQFRDNSVNAAELAAAEQGTALYNLSLNANGTGPIGTARVRFRDPATNEVREMSWTLQYRGAPPSLAEAPPSLRLAATAAYFAEYLQKSPFAADVTPRKLLESLGDVPAAFAPDPRPATLVDALTAAAALAGN